MFIFIRSEINFLNTLSTRFQIMLIWSHILITKCVLIFLSCVHCSIKSLRERIYTIPNYKVDVIAGLQKEVNQYWPKGIVHYFMDNRTYSRIVEIFVHRAMKLIESNSCIEFELLPKQPPINKTWIHIVNPNNERECVHEPIFMRNGEIILVLGYECLSFENVLHALLHGIGFKDEVTHPHRDEYIRVLWNNIQPRYRHLYHKQSAIADGANIVEYDPLSIMHFHDRAFSMNGRATIIPLEPGLTISPSKSLSQLDRMRLQLHFSHECNKRIVSDLINSCKASLGEEKGEKVLIRKQVETSDSEESSSYDSSKK